MAEPLASVLPLPALLESDFVALAVSPVVDFAAAADDAAPLDAPLDDVDAALDEPPEEVLGGVVLAIVGLGAATTGAGLILTGATLATGAIRKDRRSSLLAKA
ncbi:MAG: hypothetical protein ACOYLQ_11725 [Hyphomicrobiaceae bacterium]